MNDSTHLRSKVLVELITINPAASINVDAFKEIFQETRVFGDDFLDLSCDTVDAGGTGRTFFGLPRCTAFPGISVTTFPGTPFSGPSALSLALASCPSACPALMYFP